MIVLRLSPRCRGGKPLSDAADMGIISGCTGAARGVMDIFRVQKDSHCEKYGKFLSSFCDVVLLWRD